MYPGANNTELVPDALLHRRSALSRGPRARRAEIERRRDAYWQPYHDALAAELARLRAAHGHACSSMATASSPSCRGCSGAAARPQPRHGRRRELRAGAARRAAARARGAVELQPRHRRPLQGRLHHAPLRSAGRGRPRGAARDGAGDCYMDETPPPAGLAGRPGGRRVQPLLRVLLQTMLDWRPMALRRRGAFWAPRAWLAGGWREDVLLRSTPTAAGPRCRRRRRAAAQTRPCSPARCCPASSTRTATRSSAPSPAWPSGARATRRLLVVARAHVRGGAAHHAGALRAIAAQLYVELLRGGYTQVCEFHYLQHEARRQRYADPLAMSWRWPMPRPMPASA